MLECRNINKYLIPTKAGSGSWLLDLSDLPESLCGETLKWLRFCNERKPRRKDLKVKWHLSAYISQWQIQDFPEGGANPLGTNPLFGIFLPKTAWKWKKLDWKGAGVRPSRPRDRHCDHKRRTSQNVSQNKIAHILLILWEHWWIQDFPWHRRPHFRSANPLHYQSNRDGNPR